MSANLNMPNVMKKILLLSLLMLTLAVQAQSDLYQRYASQPGLTVAQVSGFKLNDTVRIDVVMVQSDNVQSWRRLVERFDIDDSTGVTSWLGDVDRPEHRTHWNGRPVVRVVASHKHRTVGLYRLDTEAQYDALLEYQTNTMSPRKKHKSQH